MRIRMCIFIISLCFPLARTCSIATAAAAEHEQVNTGSSRGLAWRFAYDGAGRITKLIDPAGRQTKIHYELDNNKRVQLIVKELSDSSKVTFKFDNLGRRVSMTDAHGTVYYKYDGFGRLTEVHRDSQSAISYTYDTMDRLKSVSVGEGLTTSYSYDFLGRLAKIDTLAGSICYEYQTGQGMVIRTLPKGIRTVWKYGPDGSLEFISHAAKDNRLLAQFTYSYRPDGLISAIKEWGPRGGRVLLYEYDKVHRLIAVKDSRYGEVKYCYDKLANRTELLVKGQSIPSEYDWAGRMVRYNGQDSSHDAAGNLTAYIGKHGKRTLEYNGENLLKSASIGEGKVAYCYDGDGYFTARMIGREKISFVPDPLTDIWRPLVAINAEGKRTLYIWEGNSPLSAITGNKAKFFLHDHLGSVRCIADDKGNVVRRLDYSPFGIHQQEFADSSLQLGFAGLFFDPKVSLYLTRARAYDPTIGRFLQRDPQHRIPLGSQEDLSAYAYCGNDPINSVDYTGTEPRRASNEPIIRRILWHQGQPHISTPSLLFGGSEDWRSRTYYSGPSFMDMFDDMLLTSDYQIRTVDWMRKSVAVFGAALRGSSGYGAIGSAPLLLPVIQQIVQSRPDPAHYMFRSSWLPLEVVERREYSVKRHVETMNMIQDWHRYGSHRLTGRQARSATTEGYALFPSNVGGVYLRGGSDALKHLGPLKGIAIDEKNDRLVLISEGESKIDLPPLRLDDVVTVFRGVYEHGDAPYVSIDPNPEDPEGPLMLVRHGEGTANTYVGWVLFEADRVMKAYSLGCDNVTREPVKSEIDGYQNLFDMGFSNFGGEQNKPIWERFWIVPAKVDRLQTTNKQLTLFDIPLRVKTQRMELRDGKLMPAEDDTPSEQAREFAEWFTKCYDNISGEVLSRPPEESCIDSPVAIYRELHRIALVTAIAETLRDQGVPMPAWMRNYPIKPCPVPATTPAIIVEAAKTETSHVIEGDVIRTLERTHIQRIYGGVNLAPVDEDVHVITAAPQAKKLAPDLWKKIATVPVLSPVSFMKNGKQYQAVALPGDNTRDVAPCRLVETDLVVPMQRRAQISVVRKFNSFFQPNEVFGSGWTFDLPHLEEQRQPVRRTGDRTEYRIVYQLTSPLGTYSESFKEHKFVPEVKGKLLISAHSGIFLGVADTENQKIGYPTKVLIFRDGRRWHFDDAGNLVAQTEGPLTVVYRRDGVHRIRRMEGWYGKNLRADIRLDYDKQGRLISARGSNGDVTKYNYDKAEKLTRVEGPKGVFGYRYRDGLVAAVAQNGKITREFEYNERGRLVREKRIDGSEIAYTVTSGPEGIKVSASRADKVAIAEIAHYDTAFRPVSRILEDGTKIGWRYDDTGATESTITLPQGEQYVLNRSAEGRKIAWQLPTGGTYSAEHDEGGRLIALRQGNRTSLHQQWHGDGKLAATAYETVVVHPEYREDGVWTGVFVTAPEKGPQFSRWLRIEYDEFGRPEKMTDYSGSDITAGYDHTGQVSTVVSKRGGVKIIRDKQGRVERVQTSWGYDQRNTYDPASGKLKQAEVSLGKDKAMIEFNQERPTEIKQFDGGEFNISYYDQGTSRGQVNEIHTPVDLKLTYEYNPSNQLAAVNCGMAYKLEYTYDNGGRLIGLAQVPANK